MSWDTTALPAVDPVAESPFGISPRQLATPRTVLKRPGGALSSRSLPFFWLADCSGSMLQDGKIQALNNAVREALPHMREVAAENPYAHPYVQVMSFSAGAVWQDAQLIPLEHFSWSDLQAGGTTDLGAALKLLAGRLDSLEIIERSLPPVVILISDGQPTDDYESGLAALERTALGAKAVRLAIAIGRDADKNILERFVGNRSIPILEANTPEALVRQIRWASTIGLSSSSSPSLGSTSDKYIPEVDNEGIDELEIW